MMASGKRTSFFYSVFKKELFCKKKRIFFISGIVIFKKMIIIYIVNAKECKCFLESPLFEKGGETKQKNKERHLIFRCKYLTVRQSGL